MYKIRTIAKQVSGEVIEGITIPKEIALFFKGVSFEIYRSGTSIILKSGTTFLPSKEEIKKYNFEDALIE
jgi:hypothetical protein